MPRSTDRGSLWLALLAESLLVPRAEGPLESRAGGIDMSAMLTIRDEAATGKLVRSFLLELKWEVTTLRELIRARVEHEVTLFNARQEDTPFNGLVQPTGAEQVLNGFKLPRHRLIDWKEQFEHAAQAFERNGFLVLVDDRQVESLEESIVVRETSKISFVKLVPLVGG